MREAPRNIVQALRRYDRGLGVRWDEWTSVWVLTRNGRDLFSLHHADGRPISGDLYEGEVLEIVRECDQRSNPRDMSRLLREQRRRQRTLRDRAFERMMSERAPEARDRARFLGGRRRVSSFAGA